MAKNEEKKVEGVQITLQEFIKLLKDDMGIPLEELIELFGVDRSTIFNWANGRTKRININKIREIMSKLNGRYGLRLGRITHSKIEIVNEGTAEAKSRINVNLAELQLLQDKYSKLLSENIALEKEIQALKERLK